MSIFRRNNPKRIEEIYACVAVDPTDNVEGIVGHKTPEGTEPMIGGEASMIEVFEPEAERIAQDTGMPIEIVRFYQRESVKTIDPGNPHH